MCINIDNNIHFGMLFLFSSQPFSRRRDFSNIFILFRFECVSLCWRKPILYHNWCEWIFNECAAHFRENVINANRNFDVLTEMRAWSFDKLNATAFTDFFLLYQPSEKALERLGESVKEKKRAISVCLHTTMRCARTQIQLALYDATEYNMFMEYRKFNKTPRIKWMRRYDATCFDTVLN